HVAGDVEGGDAGTERKGGEGMAEIVDPAQRLDPRRDLRGFHSRLLEFVQVELAARSAGDPKAPRPPRCRPSMPRPSQTLSDAVRLSCPRGEDAQRFLGA